MQFGICCIECLLHRHALMAREHGENEVGIAFMKEICRALADAPDGVAAPWLSPVFAQIIEKYYGLDGSKYARVKAESNRMMLGLLPGLRSTVAADDDALRAALAVARTCNYIDYSAFYERVNCEELEALLRESLQDLPSQAEYQQFCNELAGAETLLYICDNAGEIIADRLVAEQLKERYPHLKLTFAVRGSPALNDALREDAKLAGLDAFGSVIDNGSGISGVELSYLGGEMRQTLEKADVILAKGQGNFETMLGCGLNVYYLFLCKCERFTRFFEVPLLTGIFANERRLPKKFFAD